MENTNLQQSVHDTQGYIWARAHDDPIGILQIQNRNESDGLYILAAEESRY